MQSCARHKSLLLFFVLFCCTSSAVAVKNIGKLSLRDLDGNKTRLSDYHGQIVVVNFWATWCGPCKEELPRLEHLAQLYAGKHVAFVLISIDEQKKLPAVRAYAFEQKLSLAVWVGASSEQLEEFSGEDIVPATLIADQKGEIVRSINGEAKEEDITQAVDWLLAGKSGPSPEVHIRRY